MLRLCYFIQQREEKRGNALVKALVGNWPIITKQPPSPEIVATQDRLTSSATPLFCLIAGVGSKEGDTLTGCSGVGSSVLSRVGVGGVEVGDSPLPLAPEPRLRWKGFRRISLIAEDREREIESARLGPEVWRLVQTILMKGSQLLASKTATTTQHWSLKCKIIWQKFPYGMALTSNICFGYITE